MLAKNVLAEESKYHQDWLHSHVVAAGKYGAVDVFDFKPKNSGDFSYADKHAKDLLVLHFTAGWLWGDLPTLTTAHYHVSVAFVIGRSGRIYRLFDPTGWSNHLGKELQVVGGNIFNSKRSVAIELSNVGPLSLDHGTLEFAGSPYCTEAETTFYTKLGSDFRQARHFASFTPEQYASLAALIGEIASQAGVKKSFLDPKERYVAFKTDNAARSYKGIASHVNFRRTGKWDIGPAFDWAKIGG